MLNLGARRLDNGAKLAIDLCDSDCGSGTPSQNYKTAAKAVAKGRGKRRTYGKRFPTIPADELCFPSYGSPTTPYSIIAQRVQRIVSVAIQQAFAYNALNFVCTKLSASKRVVGGGAEAPLVPAQTEQQQQQRQQPHTAAAQVAVAQHAGGDDWDDDEGEEEEADLRRQPEGDGLQAAQAAAAAF